MGEIDRFRSDLFARFGEHLERATTSDFLEILESEAKWMSRELSLPEPPSDLGTAEMDDDARRLYLNESLAKLLHAMTSVPSEVVLIFMFMALVGAMLPVGADAA